MSRMFRYRRKKPGPVFDLDSYLDGNSPTKHNTIVSKNVHVTTDLLKEIYAVEKNQEWRKMCVQRIKDQEFLEKVAKTDESERVRMQAARRCESMEVIIWMRDNDPSPKIRKYAKDRFKRLPRSMQFILE